MFKDIGSLLAATYIGILIYRVVIKLNDDMIGSNIISCYAGLFTAFADVLFHCNSIVVRINSAGCDFYGNAGSNLLRIPAYCTNLPGGRNPVSAEI